jgi:hypothetical protein
MDTTLSKLKQYGVRKNDCLVFGVLCLAELPNTKYETPNIFTLG